MNRKFVYVGQYALGQEWVTLLAETNSPSGECNHRPDNRYHPREGKNGRIVIGLEHNYWADCVAVLLHEAAEFSMTRQGLAFETVNGLCFDSGGITFVMTHAKYTEVITHVAQFITPALPDLAAVYNRERKRKK